MGADYLAACSLFQKKPLLAQDYGEGRIIVLTTVKLAAEASPWLFLSIAAASRPTNFQHPIRIVIVVVVVVVVVMIRVVPIVVIVGIALMMIL